MSGGEGNCPFELSHGPRKESIQGMQLINLTQRRNFLQGCRQCQGLVRNARMSSDHVETQQALTLGLSQPLGCRVRDIQGFISWHLQVYTWLT